MAFRFAAIALLLWSLAFSAATNTDDGTGIDPHGGRNTDVGCGIDPNGCSGTAFAGGDEGNGFDPHG